MSDDLDVNLNNVGVMSFLDSAVDDTDAVYSVPLVAMTAIFKLVGVTAGPKTITDKATKEQVARPSVAFSMEIDEVVKIAPGSKDVPEDPEAAFKGRRLVETIVQVGDMSDKEFLGRIKAFITDMMGKSFSGTWAELFEEAKDSMFQGRINLRPDRNDKNVFYPQIVRGKKGDIVAV